MGFNDSMIENGFQDEEEFLEHIMDEADKEFEKQYKLQQYWDNFPNGVVEDDSDDEYSDDEYYREEWKRYCIWKDNNYTMWNHFWIWFDTLSSHAKHHGSTAVVDAFLEWEQMSDMFIGQLKNYYGDLYKIIHNILIWEEKHPIQRILEGTFVDFFSNTEDKFECDNIVAVLTEGLYDVPWNEVNNYNKMISNITREERDIFYKKIDKDIFNNNRSIEMMLFVILKSNLSQNTKEILFKEFIKNPKSSIDEYYQIKCIETYYEKEQKRAELLKLIAEASNISNTTSNTTEL